MEHEVLLDNKKYISSRDAARLTRYTQDYIGQLCREKRIVSRRVGRSWFVEEESLLAYIEQQKIEKKRRADELRESQGPVLRTSNQELSEDEGLKQGSIQMQSDRALVSSTIFVPVVGLLLFVAIAGFSLLLNTDIVKRSSTANAASALNSLARQTNPQVATNQPSEDGILEPDVLYIASQMNGGLNLLFGGIETFKQMTAQLPEGSRLAFVPSSDVALNVNGEKSTMTTVQNEGIVVVPSLGSTENKDMIQYIKNAFSDEVIVTPNADGGAGIIQPVFRDSIGKDYLYVVVPVRQ